MKAICAVAHPDDCVIFGYSLMHNFPDLKWHVVYLTYSAHDSRGQEFERFWQARNITTAFLGFKDDHRDIAAGYPSFDTNLAREALHSELSDADVILTHDAEGDYGHLHHKFVNRCVQLLCHDHVITFAPPGQGTHDYALDPIDYDQSELPLHWDIIHSFHPHQHRNSYSIQQTTLDRIVHA